MRSFILAILCCTGAMPVVAQEISFRLAVYDKINREPITGATVKLQDLSSMREYKMTTNEAGLAKFELAPATRYRIEVSTKDDGSGTGYLSYTYLLSENEARQKKTFDVELEKVKHNESGLIPAMHFDYNSATLSAENLATLDNVIKMLKSFPSLQIEIGIYADCRENAMLITRRATAIADYLKTKGGDKQAHVKEHGNVRAQNQCDCSSTHSDCPEAKYTENRRAEFKVIAF